MSETETRDLGAYAVHELGKMLVEAVADRDEARAEVTRLTGLVEVVTRQRDDAHAKAVRLRGVVEAVQALAPAWRAVDDDLHDDPVAFTRGRASGIRLCQKDLERALASVPSSGETGERVPDPYVPGMASRASIAAMARRGTPASPEPTGADEGAREGDLVGGGDGWDVIVHSTLGQPTTCKVWQNDALVFDGVSRSALLAASPVLSREALRGRLNGHWPVLRVDRVMVCDCGWKSDDDNPLQDHHQWLDHLAAVLDTQDRGPVMSINRS